MNSLDKWQVKFGLVLLWIITILTPLVILPTTLTYESNMGWEVDRMYLFIFGAYDPSGGSGRTGWIIDPMYLPYAAIFLLFFIIYALQVTSYCVSPTIKRWVIISGILSLLIPAILAGISYPFGAILDGSYAGPLPFQFIVGLIVMRLAKVGIKTPTDELLEEKPLWWEKDQTDSDVDGKNERGW